MNRLHIYVDLNGKYYYDIGLRLLDSSNRLTKFTERFNELQPRYLEDFIDVFGKDHIKIISYGKLYQYKKYIDKLLS